jgi:hypothetical protein
VVISVGVVPLVRKAMCCVLLTLIIELWRGKLSR